MNPEPQFDPASDPRVASSDPRVASSDRDPGHVLDQHGRVRRTRFGGVWIGLIAVAVVLILLLIFILQNSTVVGIHFFGFYGRISFAVALLLAAVLGVLLVAIPGTVRILQLRRSVRKSTRH